MNDLTPDLLAAIATRLYNEIPGMNHVPKSETAVAELPRQAAEMPGIPAGTMPRHFAASSPTAPLASLPMRRPSLAEAAYRPRSEARRRTA